MVRSSCEVCFNYKFRMSQKLFLEEMEVHFNLKPFIQKAFTFRFLNFRETEFIMYSNCDESGRNEAFLHYQQLI
mgnify:CR=1 FL=1